MVPAYRQAMGSKEHWLLTIEYLEEIESVPGT
jgi:hypothetical protein